jgi:ABC-type amino acid transport system permease subunit
MAFSLRTSAFQAMILKSTINSLDESQIQGGLSLGLSIREVYTHLLIPQAVILSVPSLTNELASLLKESTQALAIGVLDTLARARYVTIATGYSLLWLGITGIIMYLLSNSLILTARYLQRKGLFPGTSRDLLASPGIGEKNYGEGAKQNRLKRGLLMFMAPHIKRQSF